MPSGLSRLLEESGVHVAIASASTERNTCDRPPASYDAPRTASMQRMASDTKTSMRSMNWLYWVLPLISLGALLWYLLPSGRETVRPVTTSQSASDPTPGVLTKSAYLASAPDISVSIGSTPNVFVNKTSTYCRDFPFSCRSTGMQRSHSGLLRTRSLLSAFFTQLHTSSPRRRTLAISSVQLPLDTTRWT